MRAHVAAGLAVLFFVTAAYAADAPSATPAQGQSAAPMSNSEAIAKEKSRMVCRTLPPPTGSRLGARHICLTVEQWEEISREGRNAYDIIERRALMGRPPGG